MLGFPQLQCTVFDRCLTIDLWAVGVSCLDSSDYDGYMVRLGIQYQIGDQQKELEDD